MGTARSGTTKLQKVLAASGDFNVLTFWKSFNWASVSGVPNESVEYRIAEADAFCRWFDQRSPEAKLGHHFAALEPEEDGPLAEGCFITSNFVGYAEVPGYAAWFGQQRATVRVRVPPQRHAVPPVAGTRRPRAGRGSSSRRPTPPASSTSWKSSPTPGSSWRTGHPSRHCRRRASSSDTFVGPTAPPRQTRCR